MILAEEFFQYFRGVLEVSPLWNVMSRVKEGSPWHREESVFVHTDMVVSEYAARSPLVWSIDDMRGAFACAFHDTGKPDAKIVKYSEARGQYFSFHGHEQKSARHWENYAVENWAELSRWFEIEDIYKIGWMIEYHVPWTLKDQYKRAMLAKTANYVGLETFIRVLTADQWGRISDNHDVNKQEVLDWIVGFRKLCEEVK